ncbi:response regulator [Paracidovorax cattleyae]|uniref:CheY chemotaxis protein or a CheY-like REC (Receiver) domain n=1 Tax=Paracidovorax cattleyae TaxID=80868 RepID=A0A1H0UZV9_9BURK|nr:response regulator [Paracidovorax cattleyae]SDP71621.1 CheY chemotaxis protein or a CheY-like REC (receiver) domain [Paracidovorax cattleyae]
MVDDNEDIALAPATLLQLDGHEVRKTAGGTEALETGGQTRPEVVPMDIGMPGMSGHEACRRMRELDCGRRITIVALTGWGQDGDRRHSERAGFDGHLVKPVGFAELHGLFAGLA